MRVILSLLLVLKLPEASLAGRRNLAWEECSELSLSHSPDTQAVITGLFDIRRRREKEDPRIVCGGLSEEGVANLEAVRWALGLLNQDYGEVFGQKISGSFVPGIRIGIDAKDSCGDSNLAVQHTLASFSDLHSPSGHCVFNQTQINLGVLGPRLSSSAEKIAHLLEIYQLPVISHGANAMTPKLIGANNFFRTVPSISVITEAMVGTAREFSWNRVAVVHCNSSYGKEGLELLLGWAKEFKICVSNVEEIPSEIPADKAADSSFSQVLTRLTQNLPGSPAVLVFASKEASFKMLEVYAASQRHGSLSQDQNQLKWIFSDTVSSNIQETGGLPVEAVRGLFAVGSSAPSSIPEFDDHWTSLAPQWGNSSVWLKQLYQKKALCRLQGETSSEFGNYPLCDQLEDFSFGPIVDNTNLVPVLDAAYGFSLALKQAWKLKCNNRPGLCPQLVQMTNMDFLDILSNTEFEYSASLRSPPSLRGRKVNFKRPPEAASVFELLADSAGMKFTEVLKLRSGLGMASVSKAVFYSVNVAGQTVQSATPPMSDCLVPGCYCVEHQGDSGYQLSPGDFTIAGIFPVHQGGRSPFACGDMGSSGFGYQLTEAFWYAVQNVNAKTRQFRRILPGVKLGTLIVDSCENSGRIAHVLGGYLTGSLEVEDSDRRPDLPQLTGIVGAEPSPSFGFILKKLSIPLISLNSQGGRLDENNVLQTTVSDDTRLNLVFEILQEFGWNFVQIVYSDSDFGVSSRQKFLLRALEMGVCVAAEHELSLDGNYSQIVADMNDYSLAQVVLIFAERPAIRELLTALNNATTAKFTFIAMKFWDRESGIEHAAVDALTFDTAPAQNAAFNQYLIRQSVRKGTKNSWSRQFIESSFGCHFSSDPRLNASQICNQKSIFGQIPNFRPDPLANDVINSVYAIAFGLDEVLRKYCGDNYNEICNSLRSMDLITRNAAITEAVRNAKFRDESNRNFGFTVNNDGAIPLTIYAYQMVKGNQMPKYIQAGSYPPTGSRRIMNANMVHHYSRIKSTCSNFRFCPQCPVHLFLSQNISLTPSETTKGVETTTAFASTITTLRPLTTTERPRHFRVTQDTEEAQKPHLYQPSEENVVVGGLFPIHERGPTAFECSKKISEAGILILESFLWALDTMNQNSQVLNGVHLGAFATDTCESPTETSENLKNLFTKPAYFRAKNGTSDILQWESIFGFVNAPENEPAITAAEIFSSYKITNVAPHSPADVLADRVKFPFSLQTSIPADVQMDGLLKILRRLNFTYISVIYSRSRYGLAEFQRFKRKTLEKGICLAFSSSLPQRRQENSGQSKVELDRLILHLKAKKMQGARAVVLLLSETDDIKDFLSAMSRAEQNGLMNPGDLSLFSSVGWGDDWTVAKAVEETSLGAVTLQYDIEILKPFEEFLQTLTFGNNPRNPWWKDYWRQKFGCVSTAECSKHRMNLDEIYLSPILSNVINAVWSLAVGLANLQQDVCKGEPGVCDAIRSSPNFRKLIFDSIRHVAFSRADKPEETFQFGALGYPDINLKILNIVREKGNSGKVSFRHVGSVSNGSVAMNVVPMGFQNGRPVQLRSLNSECTNLSLCFECDSLTQMVENNLKFLPLTTESVPDTTTPRISSTVASTTTTTTATNIFTIPSPAVTTLAPRESKYEDEFRFSPMSADGYLIAAVLPLHEKGSEPFTCGPIRQDAFHNVEALTWALDQINQDPTLLPGVRLGHIILDSCSLPSRGSRDLSNFLSQQIKFHSSNESVINPAQAVGLVASWKPEEALALSQVSSQYDILTVSPGAQAELKDSGFKVNLVRTSVSNRNQAQALASVLHRMKWDSVALLYTNNVWGVNGKEDFHVAAREKGICVALSTSMPQTNCSQDYLSYDRIIAKLIALRQAGLYGVVLWTSPADLKCLLASVERGTRAGSLKRGDLVWLIPILNVELRELLDGKEVNAVGMITLQTRTDSITGFDRHWQALEPKIGDLWRTEYFESVFGCHGMNCFSKKYSLASKEYRRNPFMLNTVNAMLSIAHSVENIRRTLCGAQTAGICATMKAHPNIRKVISGAVRTASFKDYSGKTFQFTPEGYRSSELEIRNLQRNINGFEYRLVGNYNNSMGLQMKVAPRGFENGLQSFNLKERPSTCQDFAVCPICQKYEDHQSIASRKTATETAPTTEISNSIEDISTTENRLSHRQPDPSLSFNSNIPLKSADVRVGSQRVAKDSVIISTSKKFHIAGIFPLHKSADSTGLTCGEFNPSSGFQKLAAFFFALEEINQNPHILPGIDLGALALDSCSSEERAMANIFEIFTSHASGISPADVVTVLGLDGESAVNLSPMMKSLDLSLVESVPTPLALKGVGSVMGTVPAVDAHIRILADALYQMEWTYVSVLFEDSETYRPSAEYLQELLDSRGICRAKQMNISSMGTLEEMQVIVRQLVMKTGSRAVLLFLSDTKVRLLLQALAAERVSPARFIFITTFNEDWTFDVEFLTLLSRFQQGFLTVEVQRFNNTNFLQYLSRMTPQNHQPFPDEWFYEFWQHTFQCFIPGTERSMAGMFDRPCSGAENLNATTFQQSPSILPTILATQTAARGLHKFVQENCPGRSVTSMSECLVSDPKVHLMRAMKTVNFSYAYSPERDPVWVSFDSDGFMNVEYSVRNMLRRPDGNYQYQEVGVWRPQTGLLLDTNQIKVLGSQGETSIPTSRCPRDECLECPNVTSLEVGALPSLAERFDTVWGVIVAALAGLGMIVCLICILYFSITFPSNYGTTVCGYVLLLGLFLVYVVSFSFILNPSPVTCSVRRIATGLSWAFVFAPMLVKVIHSWHMKSFEDKLMGTNAHQTSPLSLLCLCLGVAGVQLVIAVEWIILDSPSSLVFVHEFDGEFLSDGMWRCTPGDRFEEALAVSMVYVIILIFLTTIFSLLTWNTDVHNRESRWVFVACIFTIGIWVCWWTLATQTVHSLRDPSAAIACVANATVILMCLYMRKAYLYQKYREEAKDFVDPSTVYPSSTVNSHFMLNGHMYGGKMMVGSGAPLFVHALPALPAQAAVMSPLEQPAGGSSVVFQNAAYDGGSEFNPGASTLGVQGGGPGTNGVVIVEGNGTQPYPTSENAASHSTSTSISPDPLIRDCPQIR